MNESAQNAGKQPHYDDDALNRLAQNIANPGSAPAIFPRSDYGYSLPDYLYEIRRERVVELFGEGYRFDDLLRWRAHSLFKGKNASLPVII